MKKNIGSADRIIRIILAIILGVLYFTNTITGTFGIVLLVVGVALLLTSFINFCPVYAIFGLSTSQPKQPKV